MSKDDYVACICEGSAEKAIINLLLNNDKLIFTKDKLIDNQIIPCRDGKTFEIKYLRKGFEHQIIVYRILDSRREKFKLSKAYAGKVRVINVITAPEIEMLIIINENKYVEFKKSGLKPSLYCKSKLKIKDVKNYKFIETYFEDIDKLTHCIKEYKRISLVRDGEITLFDLLKL